MAAVPRESNSKRPTRDDVARYANVSGWTVSTVLSGRGDVSVREDTRQRILEAARHLGYHLNHNARALVTGRTNTIGFWMCFDYSRYRAHVLHRMNQLLKPTPFELVIRDIEEEISKEMPDRGNVQIPVDGIIAFDTPTAGFVFRSSISVPFVTIGAFCTEDKDYVRSDIYAGAEEATQHLIATGRRRIVHLIPETASRDRSDGRCRAFEAVMHEAGLEPRYLPVSGISLSAARHAVREFLAAGNVVDAIFCHNDDMASGAHRALCDLGKSVGQEIALVGFDGIEETEYLSPPLTTVAQPYEQMVSLAWEFLQNRIADPTLPLQQVTLKPEMIVRASS